ncbi:MAG: NAD(P)/FAD-dependent oxidoreductase [Chlamydiia bacterium]|nr:NAD(P)/FAD-dependent oxidoreductase [Chlamydiia bacterium]
MSKKKVIIVGGGFGGINAAKALKKDEEVEILLIDKSNYHLFQPLLYQVASAALSPGNIAAPIREILRRQKNATVVMGEVVKIDKEEKEVELATGEKYPYDYLVLAPGARHAYFGHDEWEVFAPGLKTLSDAIKIREKILAAFEEAEKINDPEHVDKYLRFVIIGGGPTGVEMAGAIAEITRKTLTGNYRNIDPDTAEIILVEGEENILPAYPDSLCKTAKHYLESMGVTVLVNTRVKEVTNDGVSVGDHFIESKNVIWAAGNQAAKFLKQLDVEQDRAGRVIVRSDMTPPGLDDIFVIGDASHFTLPDKSMLPGIASVAIQQGRYVAKMIRKDIPHNERPPFSYFDKGSLATIGKGKAVGLYKEMHFKGYPAWLIWSFVHIFYLISFTSRVLVMMQWIFWYWSNKRQARLIVKREE